MRSSGADPASARPAPRHHAEVAALPLALVITLLVAWALPVRFEHRPNDVGIVSLATLQRYPIQQEVFWFLFAVGLGIVVTLGLVAWLRQRSWSPGQGLALEAAGLATVGLLLLLPRAFAALGLLPLGLIGALGWAARRRPEAPSDAAAGPRPAGPGPRRARSAAALLALALGLTPDLPLQAQRLVAGVQDTQVTVNSWDFHGELGQHLAWADSMARGGMQGRDFFSLYGPYLDLSLVGLWELVGRSVTAARFHVALQFVVGGLGALTLGWLLCRSKAALLALVPLALPINVRFGLPLLALAALVPWLRGGSRAWCGAAGVVGGLALLTSQEFGLAFLLTAAVALAVRADLRALPWFGAGLVLSAGPGLAWFLAHGALGPLLRDMASYPSWVAAGYAKLPFPPLFERLPLDPSPLASPESRWVRMAYIGPVTCAAALALCATVARPVPGRLLRFPLELRNAWRAAPDVLAIALLALYGLISFRSALGRSDSQHVGDILGAPVLLLVLGLDRTLALFGAGGRRTLGAWRVLGLFLVAWLGGLAQAGNGLERLGACARNTWALLAGRFEPPTGSAHVNAVAQWIREHTAPDEPVAFVPAGAAYTYLTQRPNPVRFVVSHQMVTDAHRAEALADLQRAAPRYLVFDERAYRVDGLPDRTVFGPALADWIERSYELEKRFHAVEIRRRRADPSPPAAPAGR